VIKLRENIRENRAHCNSWRAGGQQEGLQYNGEAAQQVIVIYIVSADEKRNSSLLFRKGPDLSIYHFPTALLRAYQSTN
jgi:hypothetical protein